MAGRLGVGRGESGVAYYRLYMIGGVEGRFIGFEEIEALDDVEAARLAETHLGKHPMELWCGKRKVRSYPAAGGSAGGATSGSTPLPT